MYSRPTSPKTIGGVLDDIFKLYSAAFRVSWPIALANAILVMPASIYMAVTLGNGTDPVRSLQAMSSSGYWASLAITLIISTTCSVAVMIRTVHVAEGEPDTFAEAVFRALRLFPRSLGAMLLYSLIVGVGMVLLLLPGIIWIVSLILWMPLIVVEDLGVVQALSRSRDLVKGNWWRTFAIYSIAAILIYILMIAMAFAMGLAAGLGSPGDAVTLNVSVRVVQALLSVVFLPLYSAILFSVYYDLKLRKEGDDLEDRVGALGAA